MGQDAMTDSPLMQLTRVDGAKIVIVRKHLVSWSMSLDNPRAQCVHLVDGHFQDVRESAAEISALFVTGA
jgi:hypothetical protein